MRKKYLTKSNAIIYLNKYKLVDADGHWLWLGYTGKGHRPHLRVGGIYYCVARLSLYAYTDFDINGDLHALHKLECNEPNCWNPEHLYAGVHADNMDDIHKKFELQDKFSCGHSKIESNIYKKWESKKGKYRLSCIQCSKNHYQLKIKEKRT